MNLHSRYTDPGPDPAVFFNADPDPAVFLIRIRIQLKNTVKNYLVKNFLKLNRTKIAQRQCCGAGPFLPIQIRVLKVRIWIRPLKNLWDLNDGFDKVLEEPD